MEVRFRNKALQVCYEKQKEAIKRWNQKVARRYVQRIDILLACTSVKDLQTFPQLRFHPLKGKLEGRYAINLDEFWRLIVSFDEMMRTVYIEEVSKHYDD
jgi:proteic killer suppression protein